MSARPRPVTATFKPKSMDPLTGVRTRSYSLSSGASTESLVSVLDHDSYESLEDSEQEDDKPHVAVDTKSSAPSSKTQLKSSDTTYTRSSYMCKSPSNIDTGASWEKWMVEKAKDLRMKQKRELMEQKRKQEEQKKKLEEQREKMQLAEEKMKEWTDKKNHQEKSYRMRIQREHRSKEEIKAMKKQETQEKATKKYEEWKQQQLNKEKEKRRLANEKKKKEQQEKEERDKKCQEAYNAWCQKTRNRPRSVHSSLGYTSGKLTGYYDANANPTPTYCNPIPWHHVEIPTVKAPKRRSKSARRWNPDKYF